MKKTTKTLLPYLLVLLINFYVLPLFIIDIGSAMVLLLVIMPCICIGSAFLYSLRHGFHIAYSVLTALLFVSTIYLHYNSSAWVYTVFFGGAALLGSGLGGWIHSANARKCKDN